MSLQISESTDRLCLRIGAALAAAAGAAVLSGCVVAPLDDGYADYDYSSTTVYTHYGNPPPPRVEYRSVAPSYSHIWVEGDWYWGGNRYDWRPGRWASPGYRPAPPPPRPQMQAPRPPVGGQPDRPHFNPGQGQRPPQAAPQPERPDSPQMRPEQRPQAPQARPEGGQRPPQQARPEGGQRPPQQARPQGPQRDDGDGRRAPPQRRDQDEERRGTGPRF